MQKPYALRALALSSSIAFAFACGGGDDDPSADTGNDAAEDTNGDLGTDAPDDASDAGETGDDVPGETGDTTDGGTDADTGQPFEPQSFDFNWPIFPAPEDPLAASDLESCAVYRQSECVDGTVRNCDIYDADAEAWVEEPAQMLLRAYLYDRWYDLYMQPDGQTAERVFTHEMAPGTAEEVWSDPANLAGWAGAGDSAIWTGTALNAYILRYLHTGTEADYQRMEEKTRVMVNFFEVTRIPGYLARHHYLLVPPGTPAHPDHIYRYEPDENPDHRDIEEPETLDFLPAHYFEELGTPRWSGDPSIDQYNGPMVAFPMVYGLLRDEALKERIAFHMVCYLNSLRRIEIRNLQANEQALGAFTELFGGGDLLNLDPGDMDFTDVDQIVMYVHPQINTNNETIYPRECGDFVQTEPWRVIDAATPGFALDVITLFQDFNRSGNGRNHINHFYVPSLRGGDAMHLMHLVSMAYLFTGDERYADFLRGELLTEMRTDRVAATMSAYLLPKFCRRFYGTNITAGPLWAFNNLLADSELDVWMQEVSRDEMWEKETRDLGNVNTNLMFAGSVSPEIGGEGREEAIRYALEELPRFGGNGGILEDPRRTYFRSPEEIIAAMPEGVTPQCPTEDERWVCERPINVFGATLPGENITVECTGSVLDCVMDNGECTTAVASHPLPGPIRYWGDYGWQRSPFEIGFRGDGTVQSPGTDYAEQYWMARFYDFIEGNREVLAWRASDEVCGGD